MNKIVSILAILVVFSAIYCMADFAPPPVPYSTAEEILQGIDKIDIVTETTNRRKTDNGWEFRCLLENATDSQIWLQIWVGQEIVYSKVFQPKTSQMLWMPGNIGYIFQWKKPGECFSCWQYKGWELDSKAAFVANILLIPWSIIE